MSKLFYGTGLSGTWFPNGEKGEENFANRLKQNAKITDEDRARTKRRREHEHRLLLESLIKEVWE